MREAELRVVVGEAFNRIDSHFTDMFRAAAPGKRIAVVNPDADGTRLAVCGLLGMTQSTLSNVTLAGVPVQRSSNLLLVPSKGEDISDELIAQIRTGWP